MDSPRRGMRKPYNQALSKDPGERQSSWANVTVRPCKPDDRIFNKWDRVRDEILSRMDLAHVSTVGCYRMGIKNSPHKPRPTIFISGNYSRNLKAIEKARQTINGILKKYNLAEMRIVFPEGRFSRHASDAEAEEAEPKPKRDLMEAGGVFHPDVVRIRSVPGQSLALKEDASSSGTFGGFFEITLPGIGKPKVVGITCFHVINPTLKEKGDMAKATIMKWREEGIKPKDGMAQHLTVSHPSPHAIKENIQLLKKEVDKIQTPNYKLFDELVGYGGKLRKGDGMAYTQAKERLSGCKALLRDIKELDAGFGRVWVASCFRPAQAASIDDGMNLLPTNYDWALIEVPPERVGGNTSPLPDSLHGVTLCISGQRSGYSEGTYNPLNEAYVDHEIIDGVVVCLATVEHGVAPKGNNTYFAKPGDSGSLVYTKDTHVVVGLCFGGCPRFPFTSYFTHIR
ncbi:hypothetical protein PENFLA_c023G01193 [Penicillium flavigenum]|uniref:Uncharacterized protein n=1 Tax=Penicillium flavigenum TaxID=254877 RepID=A0A1V6SVP9_9EURO|nr:hypothetical protein PENFLA_c023G01193 [Penicillium flavigenum]